MLKWSEDQAMCEVCSKNYPVHENILSFVDCHNEKTKESEFQAEVMLNNTITAKIFNIGKKLLNSEYMPKNHLSEFLINSGGGDIIVELGSGNRRLKDIIINIDLFPFPNVDIVADITKIPLYSSIVDFAILDTVLEHVPEPHKVIKETYRILKPGGRAICIVPFIFPYHGYPKHYFNFSKDGLEFLFRDFSSCTIEMNMGPASALTNLLSEYFALCLAGSNKFWYTLFKGIGLSPIFIFKYLDKFWKPSGKATNIASLLVVVAKK
jgi:SAM-dependent methyltransferase